MKWWTTMRILFFGIFAILRSLMCMGRVEGSFSGWSSSPTQYHVQTDEGPDRFFRYQTFNGQYRKERRMEDGTVVGSYGWVDPAGFLRMTDYIADGKGYRIVKSRTEFVGVKPEPQEEKASSHKPMKHSTRVIRQRNLETSTTELSSAVTPFTVSTTTGTLTLRTPPLRQEKQFNYFPSSPIYPKEIYVKPTTQTGIESMTPSKRRRIKKVYMRRQYQNSTTSPPPPSSTSIAPTPLTIPPTTQEFIGGRPYIIQVTRGDENTGGRNDVFKGYATPLRSGNGFLYKIPNQYHKEETEGDGSRVGSFGYVDPFGIRRVIHYNAGNTGFAHEVDFKYVGNQPTEK